MSEDHGLGEMVDSVVSIVLSIFIHRDTTKAPSSTTLVMKSNFEFFPADYVEGGKGKVWTFS